MVFYQMETEEVSDRFVAPCFFNGLKAYDGEINLGVEENMISNEYAVRLCLEHEVKRGNKVVKKELIVALRGEIYFVKFIINPKEDDVKPRVIFGRSFLRMTKAITNFEDHLLDFNIDDIPLLGEEGLPPFVCKMGKSCQEAAKEALAIRMSRKFALLEEERPIIETMAYHDKYKKILDEVWKDKVNKNVLADTGSDINTMPYRIYEQLGREDMKKVDRGITMINHTHAEAMGILTNVLFVGRGFLRTIGGIVNTPERLFLTFDGFCHQTFRAARSDVMRNRESDSDDEEEYQIQRNKIGAPIYGPKPAPKKATIGIHDDEAGSSRSKRSRQYETVEEVLLLQVHHEFLLWEGCNRDAKSSEIVVIIEVLELLLTIDELKRNNGEIWFTKD
ncbi:hypothetical protein Tco_1285643 [Tanacetum coccineum]